MVSARFKEFAPEELVVFDRSDGKDQVLEVGDELKVKIRMAVTCGVRVIHKSPNSITLATLEGHPEAGRITFGSYRNSHGDVMFHIRSRARSSEDIYYAGFLAGGEGMQATTWTDFVNRVALTTGEGVLAFIHAETIEIEDEEDAKAQGPTFDAQGN